MTKFQSRIIILITVAIHVVAFGIGFHVGRTTEYNATYSERHAEAVKLRECEKTTSQITAIKKVLSDLPVKAMKGI